MSVWKLKDCIYAKISGCVFKYFYQEYIWSFFKIFTPYMQVVLDTGQKTMMGACKMLERLGSTRKQIEYLKLGVFSLVMALEIFGKIEK